MRTNKIKIPEYFSPQVQNVIGPDGGSGCLLWSRALPTHDCVMYGGMHRVPREVYIDIHHNFVHKL